MLLKALITIDLNSYTSEIIIDLIIMFTTCYLIYIIRNKIKEIERTPHRTTEIYIMHVQLYIFLILVIQLLLFFIHWFVIGLLQTNKNRISQT